MIYLISISVFLLTFTLVMGIGQRLNRQKVISGRLQAFKQTASAYEEEVSKGAFTRFVKPILQTVANAISSSTPQRVKDHLRMKLLRAGNPGNLQATEFRGLKLLLSGLVFALGLLLPLSFLVVVVLSLIFYFVPDIYLDKRVKARQQAISLALPDVLDLLTVSVEAGLGFDSAIAKVVEKTKGPLAEEFERMLQEIRIGKPRRDALRNLGVRTDVGDIKSFVAAIVQADQLGVGIGKVLRIQSIDIRRKRRQRAEEEAMKAPIKMLFPLVGLVFPAIFIILLGPAFLSFLEAFS